MKLHNTRSARLIDRLLVKIESVPVSDKLLLRIAFFAVIGTGILFASSINQQHSQLTAIPGGSITEGIIGIPRFVNPALAITRADQDVTALIYSGLMKIDTNGVLVNDIAESVTASEDGLTYNVKLNPNHSFHDGTPLTAKDVVFTIQLIQNPDLKSPLRGNWTDVTAEEVDELELNITLKEAYAPFIENFTLGIMPAHAWGSLPIEQLPFSQLNTEPIGSGPFMVTAAKLDTSGLINHYTLTAFRNNNTNAKLDTIELSFFQNEDELLGNIKEGKIDATTYISVANLNSTLSEEYQLIEEPLPRTFGIFFNQNRSAALRDKAAREALTAAIDRDALIESALFGRGIPIYGPTAAAIHTLESADGTDETDVRTPAEIAVSILEQGGWLKNNIGLYEKSIDKELVTLSITVRTSNSPLFNSLVEAITKQWEAVGIEVAVEQFEQTGLVQSVIRPRDFQALLFGLDMSRSYDLYPFWHSSQQDDPGLNIAQYANVSVDALLETARTKQDVATRNQTLSEAGDIISQEHPAIFLFQPSLTYLIRTDITVAPMQSLGKPADRFANIAQWHTQSESLWPIFRTDME